MDFQFENGEENVKATLAFAIYENGDIGIAYHDTPIGAEAMTEVLGIATAHSLVSSMKEKTWVERRDKVHSLVRLFAKAMRADPVATIWRKTSDEVPDTRALLMFTLYGHKDCCFGNFDDGKFIEKDGISYEPSEVAYWTYRPTPPVQKDF